MIKACSVVFPGNIRKAYTYLVPKEWSTFVKKGSKVTVFSSWSRAFEEVSVVEVFNHVPIHARASIKSVLIPKAKMDKLLLDNEFEEAFYRKMKSLTQRERKWILVDHNLLSSKELVRFSKIK